MMHFILFPIPGCPQLLPFSSPQGSQHHILKVVTFMQFHLPSHLSSPSFFNSFSLQKEKTTYDASVVHLLAMLLPKITLKEELTNKPHREAGTVMDGVPARGRMGPPYQLALSSKFPGRQILLVSGNNSFISALLVFLFVCKWQE